MKFHCVAAGAKKQLNDNIFVSEAVESESKSPGDLPGFFWWHLFQSGCCYIVCMCDNLIPCIKQLKILLVIRH